MSDGTNAPPFPVLLFVDDEPSILSALRRLFRPKGFQVLLAESGAAGLEVLGTQPVDLVVSDMRMPEMDGVEFLEQVRLRWPDTMRLLLTGYADIGSIMGAINRGEIFRYIAKPWDDNDILLIVRTALQHRALEQEQRRLQILVQAQNDELKALNAGLESMVQARTAELNQANRSLRTANDRLRNNFITSIKVFTSLIELRNPQLAGHSRRVADLSRTVAQRLGLDNKAAQEIFVAGLLHEIGKVGFDDAMLLKPYALMAGAQRDAFHRHPALAAQMLMPFTELKRAADCIGAQLERVNGTGHPQHLSQSAIPLGARILGTVCDYDSLQIGLLVPRKLSPAQAQAALLEGRGQRYDAAVVDALLALVGSADASGPGASTDPGAPAQAQEQSLGTGGLREGMVLSRDLMTPSGLLMLSVGHVLDDAVIRRMADFERASGLRLRVSVWQGSPPEAQSQLVPFL
jgi:response regulator RpfG family c-di-GMP phosphodiesterase